MSEEDFNFELVTVSTAVNTVSLSKSGAVNVIKGTFDESNVIKGSALQLKERTSFVDDQDLFPFITADLPSLTYISSPAIATGGILSLIATNS